MKKNIILFVFAISAMFIYTACDDHKDDYLDQYSTVLYFLESGEVPITLYDVGENANVKVTINKAGSDESSISSVYVSKLSEALLSIYNQENETDYVMLPDNCFGFQEQEVSLTSEQPYHVLDVEIMTSLIKALPEVEGQYVLPLELVNSKDSINADKRYVFLSPDVLTPMIYFPSYINTDVIFTAEDADQIDFSVPISISSGLVNEWDFDCEVEIEESLVDAYNEKYGTKYELLPADTYTMNSTVSFASGDQSQTVDVTITRPDLRFGNYIFPIRLASSTKPEFKIDAEANVSMVPISYTPPNPPEIALTAEMLTTNAQEEYEGPLTDIIDGNVETFFHSSWSAAIYSPYGHYIDIKLESPIDLAQFAYTTRHNNNNGAPKVIELYTSSDGSTWTLLSIINRGLPEGTAADYTSTVLQADQPFTYFRIAVKESAGGKMNETESAWFAMAELKFFGQLME